MRTIEEVKKMFIDAERAMMAKILVDAGKPANRQKLAFEPVDIDNELLVLMDELLRDHRHELEEHNYEIALSLSHLALVCRPFPQLREILKELKL